MLDKWLNKLAERIGQIVAEKVIALLPIILASAFKTMQSQGQQSMEQLAENVRGNLQNVLQTNLPTVSAILKGLQQK